MIPTRTVVGPLRKAFHDQVVAALADTAVQIVAGPPSSMQSADIVSVGRATSTQEPASMGTTRQFTEEIKLQLTISCWAPGGDDVDQAVVDRAFDLLGTIEHAVRIDDTTVSGSVLLCHRTDAEFDTQPTVDDDGNVTGRVCELLATFTAMVRIRN